jgi:response regulator RpfG family c-di-GMP phosphodiesterase
MNALSNTVRYTAEAPRIPPWKVLIVDDEPEVHAVTRLVLGNFRFAERPLTFLNAHNAAQAEVLLREHQDIAVMLLDVVMETDRAGLDLVRHVRERMGNQFVRIVLRTGQPGQAPEQQVISTYDINDYKEKTELTAQKLTTTMFAALRSYRDMRMIEASRRGLERIIDASTYIFSHEHSQRFASAVLEQLSDLFGGERGALYCRIANGGTPAPDHFAVAAATGEYRSLIGRNADENLPMPIAASLRSAVANREHVFTEDHYVLFVNDARSPETIIYVGENLIPGGLGNRLVEVFSTNVSIAYENLHLNHELLDSQLEMVHLLAGAAETRSYETANHVKRVGMIAELLGQFYGLDEKTTSDLRLAAPLHDIGKIGIPDSVLNKPGVHTPEEAALMRTHAQLGASLLSVSKRPLLQLAAEIAHTHHENWDGSGYPRGLSGESIPIGGRITMLADVFDALGSRRCYKRPWPADDIRAYIVQQNGVKFEPRLVELLFENWDRVLAVREQLPDRY